MCLNDGPAGDVSIAPLEQPDGVKQSDVMTAVTAREGPGRTARDQRFSGQVSDGECFVVKVLPRGGGMSKGRSVGAAVRNSAWLSR